MNKLIMILLVSMTMGVLYSYVATKFTMNKLILYLPSYIGIILIVYMFTFYSPENTGFADLARIISAMLLLSMVIGNTFSGFIIDRKRNRQN
ncbi:hypothetical protein CIW83_14765 [Tissierella sp. P1]|uniref:hypothetical protein n=1 Tax=Tissierella sp. P1 TaxID=1280483 RepID=UPI000BA18392|nr:hypothetical protein [Tissierella sp. P1]OZV11394.1 hypothetical protein CIW83_14765 [Tissierella sp. P1]